MYTLLIGVQGIQIQKPIDKNSIQCYAFSDRFTSPQSPAKHDALTYMPKLKTTFSRAKAVRPLSTASKVVLALVSLFFLSLIVRKRAGQSDLPSQEPHPIKQQETMPPVRRKKRQYTLVGIQTLFAVLSIACGIFAISLTKANFREHNDNDPYLKIDEYFDQAFTDEDYEAAKDFQVFLNIQVLPNGKDAEVFISLKSNNIVSNRNTALRPPKFDINWPGKAELTDFTKETMSDLFDVIPGDIYTRIRTKEAGWSTLTIKWINAVGYGGLFERKIYLKTAEQAFKGLKFDNRERIYTIFVLPETLKGAVVTFSEPQLESLGDGINVIRRTSIVGDYEYINADHNFELVYEAKDADNQRGLLLIVSGILFGVAGNFFVNAVTTLLAQKI